MLVYRLCKKEEINKIFSGFNFSEIGNICEVSNKNNHKYIPNKKYIHFYDKKDSILYLNPLKDEYICTYSIPDDLLNKYKGTGKYLDFIKWENLSEIDEYAIPSELIEFEYLEKVDIIINDIEYEDFLDDYHLTKLIDNMYVNSNKNKLRR